MKVAEMIAKLKELPQDLTVLLDDQWETAITDVAHVERTVLEDDDTTGRLKKVKHCHVMICTNRISYDD